MRVLGIDISAARLTEVRMGRSDLLESDVVRLYEARADPDRFLAYGELSALPGADCVLICVPTPIDARHDSDLEPLRAACAAVVEQARPGQACLLTRPRFSPTPNSFSMLPTGCQRRAAGSSRDHYMMLRRGGPTWQ